MPDCYKTDEMDLGYQLEWIENLANILISITSAPQILQYHQDSCMAHQQVSLELAGWCGCPVFLSPQKAASQHPQSSSPVSVWVLISKGRMDG